MCDQIDRFVHLPSFRGDQDALRARPTKRCAARARGAQGLSPNGAPVPSRLPFPACPTRQARWAPTAVALLVALLLATAASPAATNGSGLRVRLLAAYQAIKSYKITVLGSVKSKGVFVAPNRYQMTTQFEGKTVKTIFIGGTYWIYSDGKWKKQSSGNSLDADIAGLVRNLKAHPGSTVIRLADTIRDGKKYGTFSYTFPKSETQETCNYDLRTFLVTRCKAEELTILYSGYNDPTNKVGNPK